jgi:hypothetical protein
MVIKKLIAVLMIAALPLGFAGMAFSAQEANGIGADGITLLAASSEQEEQEVRGTITNIEGNEITLQSDSGEQLTINLQGSELLENLEVGDRLLALVKEGQVTKVTKEED